MREQHISLDMKEVQGEIHKIASQFYQHVIEINAKQTESMFGGL
jgi:hypothetical protein